ncbi:preprotein translocase subunit SecE [Candidatus Symbiobacter mobilis]|uniref:preprotein translocase subunit SecE n=1 Tax=Candidatus Symbiobacter mobilis TaxID=1436290 RepID=UPI000A81D66B
MIGVRSSRIASTVAIGLTVGSFAGYFALIKQGPLLAWSALLMSLMLAAGVFLWFTQAGRQLIAFAADALREVQKVVWPTRKEALQTTGYVFAFVVLMALFLWLTDKSLEWILYDVLLGWKK